MKWPCAVCKSVWVGLLDSVCISLLMEVVGVECDFSGTLEVPLYNWEAASDR